MSQGLEAHARSVKVYRSGERPCRATLGDIDRDGRRLVSSLVRLGLRTGDVVAVQMPNWYENDVAIRAAVHLGLVLLPVVHSYGRAELEFILRQSGARTIILPDRFGPVDHRERLSTLAGAPELEQVVVVGGGGAGGTISFQRLVEHGAIDLPDSRIHADDVCMLVYTSGTTAEPKGVQHTHNTLLAERGGTRARP
jgi:acyl-coenzyme A synthetase/AMP-(fatty) acid ligase